MPDNVVNNTEVIPALILRWGLDFAQGGSQHVAGPVAPALAQHDKKNIQRDQNYIRQPTTQIQQQLRNFSNDEILSN